MIPFFANETIFLKFKFKARVNGKAEVTEGVPLNFWWVKKQNMLLLKPCMNMCTPRFSDLPPPLKIIAIFKSADLIQMHDE